MTAGRNVVGYKLTEFSCDRCGTKRRRKDPTNNPFQLQADGKRLCGFCIEARKW